MDLDSTWKDVLQWRSEIVKKDKQLSTRKPLHDQSLPPIRRRAEIILDGQAPAGLQQPSNAQAEKEKGNACFQTKDYAKAVDHYSKAIKLDPNVAVYFINRAMAYLKLEKFTEAERDCEQGIKLDPKNVKALWRRGLALQGLGENDKAKEVYDEALKIEPNNKAVLDELAKLSAISSSKSKRLPIKVLDQSYISTLPPSTGLPQAKTKTISAAASVPSQTTAPTRATHDPQPTPKPELTTGRARQISAKEKSPLSPFKIVCPVTNIDFERDWRACKQRGDDVLYQYLKCIPPCKYPTLFRSSLESSQFEKIIEILNTYYTQNETKEDITKVLEGLCKIRRVDMLVMFLDKQHNKALNELLENIKGSIDGTRLANISKTFGIKAI